MRTIKGVKEVITGIIATKANRKLLSQEILDITDEIIIFLQQESNLTVPPTIVQHKPQEDTP